MLIDQSIKHFGTLLHFVRHYGIRHYGIRHSGTHPRNQRKLPSVDVEIFHGYESAFDLSHDVQFVHVVNLNCDMVRSDGHQSTSGTVYQANIRVYVEAQ